MKRFKTNPIQMAKREIQIRLMDLQNTILTSTTSTNHFKKSSLNRKQLHQLIDWEGKLNKKIDFLSRVINDKRETYKNYPQFNQQSRISKDRPSNYFSSNFNSQRQKNVNNSIQQQQKINEFQQIASSPSISIKGSREIRKSKPNSNLLKDNQSIGYRSSTNIHSPQSLSEQQYSFRNSNNQSNCQRGSYNSQALQRINSPKLIHNHYKPFLSNINTNCNYLTKFERSSNYQHNLRKKSNKIDNNMAFNANISKKAEMELYKKISNRIELSTCMMPVLQRPKSQDNIKIIKNRYLAEQNGKSSLINKILKEKIKKK